MLRRIGAGAAIAWTAPVLSSLRTPAFAAQYGCASTCTDCYTCGLSAPCRLDCSAGFHACLCSHTTEGDCFCAQNQFPVFPPQACTSSTQCPTGQRCVPNINQGCTGSCLAPCGTLSPRQSATSAARPGERS
jgi:hypothetical protein